MNDRIEGWWNIEGVNSSLGVGGKISLFLSLFLLLSISIAAQRPTSSGGSSGGLFGGGSSGGGSSMNNEKDASRDTLDKAVYYYYADNPKGKIQFADSSRTDFHIYDPIRQGEYEYLHLGNLGSAHRQIVYQPRFHKGFDAGFHNYDLYLHTADSIKSYQLEKDYADFYFSSVNQQRTSTKIKFAKPIGPQMFFSIDYKNIRNEGIYTNQAARTNAFAASTNYQSKNQKYRAYLSYIANTVQQQENGGGDLTNDDFNKDIISLGRPTNTQTGDSRYYGRDLNFSHYYLLQKTPKAKTVAPTQQDSLVKAVTNIEEPKLDSLQKDSTVISKVNQRGQRGRREPPKAAEIAPILPPETGRKFTLKHNLSLRRNTYKYVDESSLTYYNDFLQDDRGIRNFIETKEVENTFSIRTFRLAKASKLTYTGETVEIGAAEQKDLVETGITHTFTKIYQEPNDSSINNIFLFGKLEFTPSERLKIKTYGHLGIGKQAGDYYVKGDFAFDFKKVGKVEGSLINQIYTPSLLNQKFIVTHQNIWQNDFKKIIETSLSGSYHLPILKLEITGNYHLIDNFIYYDTAASPQQLSSGLNIFQLKLANKIDVGRFHLENSVYFQKSTSDVIRFPEIYSIHRLSMDLKLFKVMDTQFGTDVRLNTPYFADNFQPLTAQFFLQDQAKVPFHPTIDVFLNFRIQQFRFFLVAENVYEYFTPNFSYYTYTYPQFDSGIRFGFRWLFLD